HGRARKHARIDDEGHRDEKDAPEDAEEEAESLVDPPERRALDRRGEDRREDRHHNEGKREDAREGSDDRKLAAVAEELVEHRDLLDEGFGLWPEDEGEHGRRDPAGDR